MDNIKILALVLVILFQFEIINAQSDVIEINNTSITSPNEYDFGNIDSISYVKYTLKNNRNSAVTISDVKTPAGFFADISEMTIQPNKKITVFVGLDPDFVDFKGQFSKDIVIKTNLIMDIVITLKGKIN